jgi:hypothetical protein
MAFIKIAYPTSSQDEDTDLQPPKKGKKKSVNLDPTMGMSPQTQPDTVAADEPETPYQITQNNLRLARTKRLLKKAGFAVKDNS